MFGIPVPDSITHEFTMSVNSPVRILKGVGKLKHTLKMQLQLHRDLKLNFTMKLVTNICKVMEFVEKEDTTMEKKHGGFLYHQ